MSQNPTEIIWQSGQYCPAEDCRWPIGDRGLALGDGLFETLALRNGTSRHFAAHWNRLRASALALGFADPGSGADLDEVITQLAARNDLREGSARILLSRGEGPRGLDLPPDPEPQMLVRVCAKPKDRVAPLHLALSQVRRVASNPTSRHKTLSHLDMVMSRQWRVGGAIGNESLVLDGAGNLCCVGTGNLFWIKGKALFTPSLDCAVLPGTTRARVLVLAAQSGLQVQEGAFTPKSLFQAEASFMTNALVGVRAVCRIDFGDGQILELSDQHPALLALQRAEARNDQGPITSAPRRGRR